MLIPLRVPRTCIGILTLAAMPVALEAASAAVLLLDGKVRITGAPLDGAIVVIMGHAGQANVLRSGLAHFEHALPLQSTFLLSFEREGCVTKQLYFDTHVPEEVMERAPFDFPFLVTLEAIPTGTPFEYAGPVGYIRYYAAQGDFGYDTDYSRKVDPLLVERMRNRDPQVTNAPSPSPGIPGDLVAARGESASPARRNGIEAVSILTIPSPLTPPALNEHRPVSVRLEPPAAEHVHAGTKATASSTPELADRAGVRTSSKAQVPSPERDERPAAKAGPQRSEAAIGAFPQGSPDPAASGVPARSEELVVESRRITTIIRITEDGHTTEYRRVHHQFGEVFYFKNGESCSQRQYEEETRPD
jgi:hypothetical protein